MFDFIDKGGVYYYKEKSFPYLPAKKALRHSIAYVSNIEDLFIAIKKKASFVENLFTAKKRFFDYSSIRLMKENNVKPLVFFKSFKYFNNNDKIAFLHNTNILISLCEKLSLPYYFAFGGKKAKNSLYLYSLFDIRKEKARNFWELIG